jgi:hypothetical protein
MLKSMVLRSPAFGKPGLKVRVREGSQGKEIQFLTFIGGEESVVLSFSRKQFFGIIMGLGFWVKEAQLDPKPKSDDFYEL